jgi:hypothetical protein
LLTALLVVFFWPAIFLGQSLLPVDLIYELDPVWRDHAPPGFTAPGNRLLSDQVYAFYPWKVELWRAFSERRIPLWTPDMNCGQPMMGNGQVGVWDPFWLVAHLVPLADSFLVAATLKLLIGGISTFLLARQLGITRRGATLAMITFTFSGPMVAWLGYPLPSVMAWLPLLLYLSERALAKQTAKSVISVIAVGVVLACQFLGGHPETSFHVVVTWLAFCIVRTIVRYGWQWRPLGRVLGGMVLAGVIGLALSAVQLLPLVEGILHSSLLKSRQASIPAGASLVKTILFDWHGGPTIITAILPQFFGSPIDNSYWYPYYNYNAQTFYAGIVPLALGLVTTLHWWYNRRRGKSSIHSAGALENSRGFFIGLTLLALGIALRLPVFNIINTLPVFNLVANDRMRLVYALGLALLAGHGLDTFVGDCHPSFNAPKRLLIAISLIAIVSLLCVGAAYAGLTVLHDQVIALARSQVEAMKASDHPLFHRSLDYYYGQADVRYAQMRRLYTPHTLEMFAPLGVALVAGLLEWGCRRGWNRAMWLNGLVFLTCVDLFLIGMNLNPTMDQTQIYPATEAIEFLQREPGIFRVGGLYLALMPNSGMVFGLSDVRGYDAVVPWRQATLLNHVEGAIRVGHYALLRSADSRLLDLMNVQYIITDRELDGRWKLAFTERDSAVRVYRNRHVLPRAFVVYQAEFVDSAEAALARLLDDTFDFRTGVILEGPVVKTSPGTLSALDSPPESGIARIVSYEPERVVVETDSPADGWLVLTDTYMPGWQVQIDGRDASLHIADYAFRGVFLPAGQHRVEFAYTPASYAWGATISLATLVLLVGVGGWQLARQRRSGREA